MPTARLTMTQTTNADPGPDRLREVLGRNLAEVRVRIHRAAARCGREPDGVRLLAATKYVGHETILALRDLGVTDIGENRVAEAEAKAVEVDGVRWHMIGHLQRNKAARAIRLFASLHSLDSERLATVLDRQAAALQRVLPVFLEVNLAAETSKTGVLPADLPSLLAHVRSLPCLEAVGLMAMPPITDDSESSRPYFRRLAGLARELAERGSPPLRLSMGMSADFEVAIEEGASEVRIGSALFLGLRD